MQNLKEVGEPADFWYYFEKISKIPRGTGKEDKIREFIKREADKFGFQNVINVGNSFIF